MTPSNDRTSLWLGHRAAPAPTSTPGLPATADVLVVGAGLTGLSTAVLLARAGRQPVVIDKGRAGGGATGHSSAKVSLLQGSKLQRLADHVAPETVRAYVDGSREGQAWLREVLTAYGVEPEVRTAVTYATTERGARDVEREREASLAAGLDVVDLPDPGFPFDIHAAIALPEQLQIDPVAAVEALRAELEGMGGSVIEGVRVTGVPALAPWVVETSAGTVTAERVVLATQAPILDRTLHVAGLRANRSYLVAYAVETAAVPQEMALSLDDPTRSFRTATIDGSTWLLVGGQGHVVGRGGSAREHVDALDAWAKEQFGVGEAAYSWAAQDYHLSTELPAVGPVLGSGGGLLQATGFDKWGMTTAVAAAMILAGEITGDAPSWAAPWRSEGLGLRDAASAAVNAADIGSRWVAPRATLALPGGDDTDPPEGEGRVEGGPLNPVAVATVDGTTCRVSAVCPHLGGILTWNDAERSWDCPLHGSRFAARGELLEGPATSDLSPTTG